jgi:hypothetical protein
MHYNFDPRALAAFGRRLATNPFSGSATLFSASLPTVAHLRQLAAAFGVAHDRRRESGKTPGIGGGFPVYTLIIFADLATPTGSERFACIRALVVVAWLINYL